MTQSAMPRNRSRSAARNHPKPAARDHRTESRLTAGITGSGIETPYERRLSKHISHRLQGVMDRMGVEVERVT